MIAHRWQDIFVVCALVALTATVVGSCGPRGTQSLPTDTPPAQPQPQPAPTQTPPTLKASTIPSPTSTLQPTATADLVRGAACLPGEWKLEDAEAYFEEALLASGSPAQLRGVAGSLIYSFNAEGLLQITFVEFFVSLNAPVEGGSMVTRSSLDGSAEANFRALEDSELVLSGFRGEGVLFVIEVDGQLLVQTTLPAWASFFAALSQASGEIAQSEEPPAEVAASFDCAGDRLALRGAGLPVEMVLVRAGVGSPTNR